MKCPSGDVRKEWGLEEACRVEVKILGFILTINSGGLGKDSLFRGLGQAYARRKAGDS